MTIVHAFILGLIQGLTEFLPVSSSGHLILVPYLFGWATQPLYFDVALHWGTLAAVIFYFYQDWKKIILSLLKVVREPIKKDFLKYPIEVRLGLLVGLGTFPALIIAFLFQNIVEEVLRSPYVVIVTLIVVALFMYWVEHKTRVVRDLKHLKPLDAIIIGFSQALALIPGTSRSGITISTGIFQGLSREEAAKFSFLLSTPIILAAGLYEAVKIFLDGSVQIDWVVLIVGFVVSALTGFLAIKFLMKYLQKQKMTVFVIYRIGLAVMILITLLINR